MFTTVSSGIAYCGTWPETDSLSLGIDKLTEKSQVSEDGTMVAVAESPQSPEHGNAEAGASDTESISGRDSEVRGKDTDTFSARCPRDADYTYDSLQDVFYTEAEMERRRRLSSSSSSVCHWNPKPDWVRRCFFFIPKKKKNIPRAKQTFKMQNKHSKRQTNI